VTMLYKFIDLSGALMGAWLGLILLDHFFIK